MCVICVRVLWQEGSDEIVVLNAITVQRLQEELCTTTTTTRKLKKNIIIIIYVILLLLNYNILNYFFLLNVWSTIVKGI
jgi:hypothetical protein